MRAQQPAPLAVHRVRAAFRSFGSCPPSRRCGFRSAHGSMSRSEWCGSGPGCLPAA